MRVRFIVSLGESIKVPPRISKSSEATKKINAGPSIELSTTDKKILEGLRDNDLSRRELLDRLGYTQKTGNFKKSIARLLAAKYITYTIPEKPNSRLQKYRITPQGEISLKYQPAEK